MKVQDAIAEDKRRGGDGVAVHAGGKHARGRGCDNVLETTPRRGGEFSATRCYEIRELQSDDWEPMTPEPVCEPAPEWEEWRRGPDDLRQALYLDPDGHTHYHYEVAGWLMPDGSPRFGRWEWVGRSGMVEYSSMTSHVMWKTSAGTYREHPIPSETGGPVFAAHARMRKLPKGGK
ncbi:MAG TPA: hypothetical protein VM487_14225 [Phycisphaerae bacterium]|nr:hypothetical protein [Phycisphaerae bacterium]